MGTHNGLRMNWGRDLGLGHTGSWHDRHRETVNLFACRRLGGWRLDATPLVGRHH